MRVLITGASGLLGGRLCDLLSAGHSVTGLIRARPGPAGIATVGVDLVDATAVEAAFALVRPQAIVHCAALADAEACERDPALALRENVEATRILARACHGAAARLIAISTDLVFGGEDAFASETSTPRPLTEYGRSKLAAESIAITSAADAVVLRVALVSGRGFGPRLSSTEGVARSLRAGEPVTLYEDEWRTPVDAESVAAAIGAVLDRPSVRGCFHIAGSERLTRVQLGERVADVLGSDVSLIRRVSQASHRGAPRPRDVSLDITRARTELGFSPRPLGLAILQGRLELSTSAAP